jgi:hypothetical protein
MVSLDQIMFYCQIHLRTTGQSPPSDHYANDKVEKFEEKPSRHHAIIVTVVDLLKVETYYRT